MHRGGLVVEILRYSRSAIASASSRQHLLCNPTLTMSRLFSLKRIVRATTATILIAGVTTSGGSITLTDPELAVGQDALDPVGGSNAGALDITLNAGGAPLKSKLMSVPGMRVVQSFTGFEGAVQSPVNRIKFSDTALPEITFSINGNTGYGGCHAAAAFSSGPVLSERVGESVYLGDNVNETAYTIEFSAPVAAVAFVIGRAGATTGPSPTWPASFYGVDGQLIGQQNAQPGHGPNVAVLFGHIAVPGTAIKRVVFGKSSREVSFVMGNNKIYLDDLAFAPLLPGEAPAGVVKAPVLAKFFDPAGGESIDVPAQGATPKSFVEALPDFGVVYDWAGFRGKTQGDAPGRNYLDFAQGPDFRFELGGTDRDTRGLGGATEAPELATSPGTAVALGGGAGFRYYEITAGLYDAAKNAFISDAGVYAMGFVLSGRDVDTQAVATFYNRSGEILSVQTAGGMRDPANAASPEGRRGVELYFGHIASSASDQETWVHRVRVVGRSSGFWGLDDFGFSPGP